MSDIIERIERKRVPVQIEENQIEGEIVNNKDEEDEGKALMSIASLPTSSSSTMTNTKSISFSKDKLSTVDDDNIYLIDNMNVNNNVLVGKQEQPEVYYEINEKEKESPAEQSSLTTSSTTIMYNKRGIPLTYQKLTTDRYTFSFSADLISQFDNYRSRMRESIRQEMGEAINFKYENPDHNKKNENDINDDTNNDNEDLNTKQQQQQRQQQQQQQQIITSADEDDDDSTMNNDRSINRKKKKNIKLCFSRSKKNKKRQQRIHEQQKKSSIISLDLFKKMFS